MKPVWHIYYGTRGTAGAYIDSLIKSSIKAGLKVKAFVSCNYVYKTEYCKKCFFPITDKSEKRNRFILLLRAFELIITYIYLAVYATVKRPTINLHLIDDLKITYYLIKYFKLIKLEVYVTCHDVKSHYLGKTELRSKIMNLADKLVVHNKNAKTLLKNTIGESTESKVRTYPFPFSSYDEVVDKEKLKNSLKILMDLIPQDKPFFLFLGVVKMQKGIQVLIDAWQKCNEVENANLVIAGKWTDPSNEIRKIAENDPSCIIIDKYLSDEEFVLLIEKSKFIVLPYLNYTHSSVLVSCGNHGGAVINSDIKLFEESMPDYPLVFKSGDELSLASLLNSTARMNENEVNKYRKLTKDAIQKEKQELVEKLKLVYNE